MTVIGKNPIIAARQQFADANGWRVAKRGFHMDVLVRGGMHSGYYGSHGGSYLDHAECYRKDRFAVAMVGHQYGDPPNYPSGMTQGIAIAERYGLIVHVAPAGKVASWYYPHFATLIVVTRPGIEVVWPTAEQMAMNEVEHALFHEQVRRAHRELEERTRLRRSEDATRQAQQPG